MYIIAIDSPQILTDVIAEYAGDCYFELANNDAKIEHYDTYSLVYIVKKLNDSVIVENTPPLKLFISNTFGNFPINTLNVFGDTIKLNYEIDNRTLVAEEVDVYKSWLLLKRISLLDLRIISEEVISLNESSINPILKLS